MRCVHCNTTETPLWRAGPAGPKTLCNACGVRWKKTGSLIPRSKRPSSSTSTTAQQPPHDSHPALRKRARPNPPPPEPRLPLPAPAPRPVSVFRVADATRSRYESVFSGLMVVRRDEPVGGRRRAPSMKVEAPPGVVRREDDVQPCPSPPPVECAEMEAPVYVTEVHAPSPSPSPPPMPRVTVQEGGTFRLLLAAVAETNKPPTPIN